VERWRSSCGCAPQDHPGWTQEWRGPLRDALDWLRDEALSDFEGLGGDLLDDPWEARDAYIEVLVGGSPQEFIGRHCKAGIDDEARETALALLEIQLRAMLMYTSCGWFFDDVDRLESVFVLRQAGRLIDVSRSASGRDLEPEFLLRLDEARSNKGGSARDVYQREVSRYMTGL
jgi:alpha-amylase/alpha-mannosidase (GH57 family)